MSQTHLETTSQTQGAHDLASQHVVLEQKKKLRHLGVCNPINPWYSATTPKSNAI